MRLSHACVFHMPKPMHMEKLVLDITCSCNPGLTEQLQKAFTMTKGWYNKPN